MNRDEPTLPGWQRGLPGALDHHIGAEREEGFGRRHAGHANISAGVAYQRADHDGPAGR